MKLKSLIDVLTNTQPINICISGNDDFEIAGRLGSIPEKFLVTMWDSDVVGVFSDDCTGTLIVVLKGDDGDDEGAEN